MKNPRLKAAHAALKAERKAARLLFDRCYLLPPGISQHPIDQLRRLLTLFGTTAA